MTKRDPLGLDESLADLIGKPRGGWYQYIEGVNVLLHLSTVRTVLGTIPQSLTHPEPETDLDEFIARAVDVDRADPLHFYLAPRIGQSVYALVEGEWTPHDADPAHGVIAGVHVLSVFHKPPEGVPLRAVLKPPSSGSIWSMAWVEPDSATSPIPRYCDNAGANLIWARTVQSILEHLDFLDDDLAWSLRELHAPVDVAYWMEHSDTLAYYVGKALPGARLAGAPVMPSPRLIKTAQAAEAYAAEVLTALGFVGTRTTPPGADGGVDVDGPDIVAQVKMEALPTGRPVIQQIYGVAAVSNKRAAVFSLAGYTAEAMKWGETAGVLLFEFAFDGSIEGRSAEALRCLVGP